MSTRAAYVCDCVIAGPPYTQNPTPTLVFAGQSGYNESAPGGATNTLRGLTHSSDVTREGLGMNPTRATCQLDDCDQPVKARGYCNRHYLRDYRNGHPTAGAGFRYTDDETRLWSQIDTAGPCWDWTGSTTVDGYGTTTWDGTRWRVHRLVWTLLVGPIADGLQLDHLCRNRACANPDHLEPVTQRENIRRGSKGGTKPCCSKGHRYDIFIERRGGVERRCSTCEKAKRKVRTQREAAHRRGGAA